MSEVVQRDQRRYVPADKAKLANVDVQALLDRVAAGELLREIAADYGCSTPAVHYHIQKRVTPEEWADVKQIAMANRLEKSAEDMETAADPLNLARARESARLWMWRAERELPAIYGARPTTAVQVNAGEGGVQLVVYGGQESVAGAQHNGQSAVQQMASAQDLTSDSK